MEAKEAEQIPSTSAHPTLHFICMRHFLSYLSFLLMVVNQTIQAKQFSLFIGTSGQSADGIYHAYFQTNSGRFEKVRRVVEVDSPNFLSKHPNHQFIYAVCKWKQEQGVIGYKITNENDLVEFTRMACPDGLGCHISVHPSGKFLLTTQYRGGSVALFPLSSSGELLKPVIYRHQGGSGVVRMRQSSPHPHWCGFSPCGNFALIPDLGLDQIVIYRVNAETPSIQPHGFAKTVPGGGPRHMRFSQDQDWIYLLNELDLSISIFKWDHSAGEAIFHSWVDTLKEEQKAQESFNSAAEILVHPKGNWVYSSNRGHDSVTVFTSNNSGSLEAIQTQPIRGAFPRNINLTPCGTWLLAAGQDSSTVSGHRIHAGTGKLTYQRGSIAQVPNPVCLVFLSGQKNLKK